MHFCMWLTINTGKDKQNTKDGKCFKVNPLLKAAAANCNKIEPESNHMIDGQIILAKTKKIDGVRQDNQKKSHNWASKI